MADISTLKVNGQEYYIKDQHARELIEGTKTDASSNAARITALENLINEKKIYSYTLHKDVHNAEPLEKSWNLLDFMDKHINKSRTITFTDEKNKNKNFQVVDYKLTILMTTDPEKTSWKTWVFDSHDFHIESKKNEDNSFSIKLDPIETGTNSPDAALANYYTQYFFIVDYIVW